MADGPHSKPESDPVPKTNARSGGEDSRQAEEAFLELRRKVQESELLSAATERLLMRLRFNGRLSVVVQHGRVVKSAYEEGYFRRK